jgi:hypothetical protein
MSGCVCSCRQPRRVDAAWSGEAVPGSAPPHPSKPHRHHRAGARLARSVEVFQGRVARRELEVKVVMGY